MKKNATKRTFKAKLTADSGGLFFQVPFDVKAEFGKARAPVRVTLGKYTYASTVAVYGGKFYVPVRREHREGARVTPGTTIRIRLELDEAKRDVKVPADLARALRDRAGGNERWQTLSYTHRREHVQAILEAKQPETRARRVAKAVAAVADRR